MVSWLIKNKEWFFSGLGVFIFGLFWSILLRKKSDVSNKNYNNVGQNIGEINQNKGNISLVNIESAAFNTVSKNTVDGRKQIEEELLPEAILNSIENAPPLQQEDIKKHYIDLDVEWIGYLTFANKLSNGTFIRITLETKGSAFPHPMIVFTVRQDKYPELGILKKGHKLKVRGKIFDIDFPRIYLEHAELTIL